MAELWEGAEGAGSEETAGDRSAPAGVSTLPALRQWESPVPSPRPSSAPAVLVLLPAGLEPSHRSHIGYAEPSSESGSPSQTSGQFSQSSIQMSGMMVPLI